MQILGCSYDDIHGHVSVSNIRLTNTNLKERTKYVDLLIEYHNEKIIIELNNNYDGNYMRNLLYAFNAIMNNYNIDDEYADYANKQIKIILVNLNWHRRKRERERIISKDEYIYKYPDELIDDYLLKVINVNLDYYEKKCYTDINGADKLWKLLTISDKNVLNRFIKDEKLLKSYEKALLNLSEDKEYCKDIMNEKIEQNLENERLYRLGNRDGIEQGIEEGRKQERKETIINMYNNGISLDIISSVTKLSSKEIKEIISAIADK